MKRNIGEWRKIAEEEGHNVKGRPNPFAAAREHSKKHGWTELVRNTSTGGSDTLLVRRFENGNSVGGGYASTNDPSPKDFAWR